MKTAVANAYTSSVPTDVLVSVIGGISGTRTFSYDANGNVRSENANGHTLTFNTDYEDKPLSITGTTPAGVSVSDTYAYNGLGMRQTGPGLNPLTDGETPGSPILVNGSTTYTPGISQSGGPHGSLFYFTDARDQLRAREDSSWTVDDDLRYDPWGNLLEHGGNAPSALTQGWGIDAAYQQDGDTGLTLMGNRYYDPTLGRFLSLDHAKSGDNWYAYCGNSPLTHSDPTGNVGYSTAVGPYMSAGQTEGVLESSLSNGSFDAAIDAGQVRGQLEYQVATAVAAANDFLAEGMGNNVPLSTKTNLTADFGYTNKYGNMDAAAIAILKFLFPISQRDQLEFGGFLIQVAGGVKIGVTFVGISDGLNFGSVASSAIGVFHTHPQLSGSADYPEWFSQADVNYSIGHNLTSYIATPNFGIRKYVPWSGTQPTIYNGPYDFSPGDVDYY